MCKSTPNSGSDLVLVPDFRLRGPDFGSDLVLVRPGFARPKRWSLKTIDFNPC